METFKLEKTHKIKSNHYVMLPNIPLNDISNRHIRVSLKYLQGWWLHPFPGQLDPMPNYSSCEEIHPDI